MVRLLEGWVAAPGHGGEQWCENIMIKRKMPLFSTLTVPNFLLPLVFDSSGWHSEWKFRGREGPPWLKRVTFSIFHPPVLDDSSMLWMLLAQLCWECHCLGLWARSATVYSWASSVTMGAVVLGVHSLWRLSFCNSFVKHIECLLYTLAL